MHSTRWWLVGLLVVAACSSKNGNNSNNPQCSNGKDDDGDGLIDFPDDPGCVSPQDDSEDSPPSPQCADGRDNDNDGKIDFPADPGCFAPNQDSEVDDCPNGPTCPQCADGIDNDGNGLIDFPADPGCSSASDTDEYTENLQACGPDVHIKHLPFNNIATGTFAANTGSALMGQCGGAGIEDVYELRINAPKVVVATTDNPATNVDTVMYIRSSDCTNPATELACNDNISPTDNKSSLTQSLMPGTYYLVVDTKDASQAGNYTLTAHFFVGEGVACQTGDDCGPGLVCRIPLGGSTKVCSKHVCSDGVDDDGDGKIDYPDDPGCISPTDDDETDDCPSGPMCPECGNGRDDDGDGLIDYPADPDCIAASSSSESCRTHELVPEVTQAMTMGDTTTATSDFDPTCAFDTGVPDLTYMLDLPGLQSLNIDVQAAGGAWYPVAELLNSTCGGTALVCNYPPISKTNVAAGKYFVVVDGDSTTDFGPFTLSVSGTIKPGASCEKPLAVSGALVCAAGYACKGTMGSRTCQAAQCNDGIDNDGNGKIDYPNDPGCTSPGDDTEAPPATPPVCANNMDDDGDGLTDWPADWGCVAASGASEVFCVGEHDVGGKITTKTTTGTTAGKANDEMASCSSFSSAPDVSYALQLPVPVASLQIDLLGSSYDTVMTIHDANCGTEIACNDDFNGTLQSGVVLSNVLAGGYAITVDGYSSNSGAYTLHVRGTVASGTVCNSALFSGGTNAVLVCPTGTTCSATTHRCQ
jgi:hypothetical protein